jgi:hypothetical protein
MRDTEKRRDRKHRGWSRLAPELPGNGDGAPAAPKAAAPRPPRRRPASRVVRARATAAKPMGVDEAALAMESSGENVLVFRDSSNDRVSVLYRRRDGDLGLIVPEC